MPEWREQYDRMKRWQRRVAAITPSDHAADDVYAFFQSVHHFKEWLRSDPAVTLKDRVIEDHINNTRCLRIAADLCNASKHAMLTTSRSNENPDIGTRTVISGGLLLALSGSQLVYMITTDGGTESLHLFSQECLDAWGTFLRQHGMLNPAC